MTISLDHNALYHALKKEAFHSSILDLEIDGTTQQVLLRDFQVHAFKQLVLHADFQRVEASKSTLSAARNCSRHASASAGATSATT